MKGFQNSFLVHYTMNFLLIFLTDKTSVRMESIYKNIQNMTFPQYIENKYTTKSKNKYQSDHQNVSA